MAEEPEIVEEKHLKYLDTLRETGVCNMFGAGEWLEHAFDLSKKDARTILTYWMQSFDERHSQ